MFLYYLVKFEMLIEHVQHMLICYRKKLQNLPQLNYFVSKERGKTVSK